MRPSMENHWRQVDQEVEGKAQVAVQTRNERGGKEGVGLAALSLRLSRRRLLRQVARESSSSREDVSSLAASSSLSSSLRPLTKTPCRALSSHPHSTLARILKSTEYWETVLDPCCNKRSQLLAS